MAISTGTYRAYIASIVQPGQAGPGDNNPDWLNDTIKAMLTEDTETPLFDTEDYLDDVVAERSTGTTDATIVSKVVDTATAEQVKLQGGNITYTAVGDGNPAVGGIITYRDAASDATRRLITMNDFTGGNLTPNGGNIDVTITDVLIFDRVP